MGTIGNYTRKCIQNFERKQCLTLIKIFQHNVILQNLLSQLNELKKSPKMRMIDTLCGWLTPFLIQISSSPIFQLVQFCRFH
jgi:hypothetical protein